MITDKGKLTLPNFNCVNCGNQGVFELRVCKKWRCGGCGARYVLISYFLDDDDEVKIEYKMSGFTCMKNSYLDKCDNECPSTNMYCKDHSTEMDLQKALEAVSYAKKRVSEAELEYKRVEESRKAWLISGLSGIDEE